MELAMASFGHREAEVRESSVRLVAACYARVGLGRIERYLANLRHSQREVFDAVFERVSMGGGSHPGSAGGRRTAAASCNLSSPPTPVGSQRSYTSDFAPAAPAQHEAQPHPTAHRAAAAALAAAVGSAPPPVAPAPAAVPVPCAGAFRGVGAGEALATHYPSEDGFGERELAEEDDEEDYEEVEEFTCQFCLRQDPGFTEQALDMHFWRECPMLTECALCEQVVEIRRFRAHLLEECEAQEQAVAAARRLVRGACPFCQRDIPGGREKDWRQHLLCGGGCPLNPRQPYMLPLGQHSG